MLKDGKFIKEDPPKIGAMYEGLKDRQYTAEEYQWQYALLEGVNDDKPEMHRIVERVVNILKTIRAM